MSLSAVFRTIHLTESINQIHLTIGTPLLDHPNGDARNRFVSLLEAARPQQEQCMSAGPPLFHPDNGIHDVPLLKVLPAWAIVA